MLDFIRQWRERREEAAIERANFERTVQVFIADTRPFVPVAAKYPEAALYRHAWKRPWRFRRFTKSDQTQVGPRITNGCERHSRVPIMPSHQAMPTVPCDFELSPRPSPD